MKSQIQSRGFTVIELMVTLSILAILAAIAVPSFSSYTASQRLRSASFDLHSDLLFARSEALKRNQSITVRRREAAGWQTGWVVLEGATELRTRGALGSGVSVNSPAAEITFNSSGRVAAPAGGVEIGLDSRAGAAQFHRCMVITPSGMPRAYAEECA